MPEPMPGPIPTFEGHSTYFRVVPWLILLVALSQLGSGHLVVAAVIGAISLVVASLLPWRFVLSGEGVLLSFAMRGDRFYSKQDVAIRLDEGGAVLLPTPTAQRGYVLVDGILSARRAQLHAVLRAAGFRLV